MYAGAAFMPPPPFAPPACRALHRFPADSALAFPDASCMPIDPPEAGGAFAQERGSGRWQPTGYYGSSAGAIFWMAKRLHYKVRRKVPSATPAGLKKRFLGTGMTCPLCSADGAASLAR